MYVDSSNFLYIGGNFTTISGVANKNFARYDPINSSWLNYNANLNNDVYTIEVNYFESAWSYVFNNIDDHTLVDLGHNIK